MDTPEDKILAIDKASQNRQNIIENQEIWRNIQKIGSEVLQNVENMFLEKNIVIFW